MNIWQEVNDFGLPNKKIPCILCGGESNPTVVGNHFKCSVDGHVFNEDHSPLPENVECWCEPCRLVAKAMKEGNEENSQILIEEKKTRKKKKGKR
jgi:hypothetical protein